MGARCYIFRLTECIFFSPLKATESFLWWTHIRFKKTDERNDWGCKIKIAMLKIQGQRYIFAQYEKNGYLTCKLYYFRFRKNSKVPPSTGRVKRSKPPVQLGFTLSPVTQGDLQDEVSSLLWSKPDTEKFKNHTVKRAHNLSPCCQKYHQIMRISIGRGERAKCFFPWKEDYWAQYLIHFTLPPSIPPYFFLHPWLIFSIQSLYFSLASSNDRRWHG